MNILSNNLLKAAACACIMLISAAPAMAAKSADTDHAKKSPHGGAMSQDSGPSISGKVLETMNSGGYTYVKLENSEGDNLWVAAPEFKAKVGEVLFFNSGMVMQNFKSSSLKRTFDSIVFSNGPVKLPGTKGAKPEDVEGLKGHGLGPTEHVKLDKPDTDNGYAIADIYAKAVELDKKHASVRGKVVKYSSGIMGMNWLHLQDGSGDPKKDNHDLVVTTSDEAEVGDTVVAAGTVVKDKDFGSGYSYSVIIENATVVKEASDKANTKVVPAPTKSPAPLGAHSIK